MDIKNELNDMFKEVEANADKESFGTKLHNRRKSLGLKLVDVVRKTKLSESLIVKLEADKVDDIRISTMKKLCLVYELEPKFFISHLGIISENDSKE